MTNLNIDNIINSPELPSLPTVALKLVDASRNPDIEIRQITDIIKADPAIAGKILKSANSSYFGFSSKCTSIDRAVNLLGMKITTSLALSFSLADDSFNNRPLKKFYDSYWLQSILQASSCEKLGALLKQKNLSDFFLAGLVIDIGRLAMLKTIPREYFAVLSASREQSKILDEVELNQLGFDHAQISSRMIALWNFPDQFTDAIYQHNQPAERLIELFSGPGNELQQAMVTAANIGEYFCSADNSLAFSRVKILLKSFFKIEELEIENLLISLKDAAQQAGELFEVETGSLPEPGKLIAEANQRLLQMAMQAHVQNNQLAKERELIEQQNTELRQKNQELKEKTDHDNLTGVFNRAYFDQEFNSTIEKCRETAEPVSLIFLDIDKFKSLNDNYGHMFGDQVLKSVAKVLKSNIRSNDILARYGGEEFVIIAKGATSKGLEKLCERLRSCVESNKLSFGEDEIKVTISIGATLQIPARTENKEAKKLIETADSLMYNSKHQGRNRVSIKSLLTDFENDLLTISTTSRFSRWLVNKQYVDIQQVTRALVQTQSPWKRIGELATEFNLMNEEQISKISQIQETSNKRFGEVAVSLGILNMKQLGFLIAIQQEKPDALGDTLCSLGILKQSQLDEYKRQYFQENLGDNKVCQAG